jgi:CRP-like cAMP-binding protein
MDKEVGNKNIIDAGKCREASLTTVSRNILIGECLAEFTLFDEIEQSCTITAIEDCELLLLRRADFDAATECLRDIRSVLKNIVIRNHQKRHTKRNMKKNHVEHEVSLQTSKTEAKLSHNACKILANVLTPMILFSYLYSIPFQASFLVHWEIPGESWRWILSRT